MIFNMIGNMNTYLKSMEMQNIWNLKKKSGDYNKGATDLNQWLDQIAENTRDSMNAEKDDKLSEILQKYYAGSKLSPEERAYLRDHAPEVYRELVNLEQEQAAYERELRRCETKEEVERLRMTYINSSLVTVNAVSNNANIPEGAKMAILAMEKRRLDAISESTREFVASGEYAELPTEAEEAKAKKEMLEELYLESEQKNADAEELMKPEEDIVSEEDITQSNESLAPDNTAKATDAGVADNSARATEAGVADNSARATEAGVTDNAARATDAGVTDNAARTTDAGVADNTARATDAEVVDGSVKNAETRVTDDSAKKPESEIDVESQEERKVRRAKAKAAYAALSSDLPASGDFSVRLDLKA